MPARIATYNYGDPKATALDRLATLADFICTQEGGDRDPDVATFRRNHPGWDVFGADLDKQRGKTPILYNAARYEVLDSGAVPMDDGKGAGKPGAGGGERKWLLWLLVRDRETGAVFYVANTHAVPSLRYRNRRRHHAEHMRRIAAWARDLEHPVVVTMDANAKWSHDNLDPLRAAGFRLANGPEWTHKRRLLKRRIDLILVRGAKVLSAEVIDTPSDHRAVVAVLDVPAVVAPKPEPEEPAVTVYPLAVRKLIPPGSNDPRIKPTQVILHVAVSEGASLYDFFKDRSGGIESHFYIRRDGTVEQYRDTFYQADANHTANDRAISVETQGMGDGEWTPQQLASIKALLAWAHKVHGIPLRPCPAHDQPGVGYHVMFGAPGPWTPVSKSCPGPDRIKQFNRDLVPWMTAGGIPTTTEDDMPLSDEDLDKIAYRVWAKEIGGGDNRKPARLHLINSANASLRNESARAEIAALKAAVDKGASKDDLKRMLENLDVTLQVIVSDDNQE